MIYVLKFSNKSVSIPEYSFIILCLVCLVHATNFKLVYAVYFKMKGFNDVNGKIELFKLGCLNKGNRYFRNLPQLCEKRPEKKRKLFKIILEAT